MAACVPASTALAIARRATMVLPLPTSPCSRRNIRQGALRSPSISAKAMFWAWVREKGISASIFLRKMPVPMIFRPGCFFMRRRTSARASWLARSSSNAKRQRAGLLGSKSARSSGAWARARVLLNVSHPCFASHAGSCHSGKSGSCFRAPRMAFCSTFCVTPWVRG